MEMKVYVVNAFAEATFGGNPAAVVPLQEWPAEGLMQQIASQHNLAETAFVVPQGGDFAIRWFTPSVEVALCGHATLASAHVYFHHLGVERDTLVFHSKSGPLMVKKATGGRLTLDFPEDPPVACELPPALAAGLKTTPVAVFKTSFDYMAVLAGQQDIENLSPDMGLLKTLPVRGVLVTAPGKETDFVSRCFFPQSGIDEDPVTGSAHTALVPYWAGVLGKSKLAAVQLSQRRGYLACEWKQGRVLMTGRAATYLSGVIYI